MAKRGFQGAVLRSFGARDHYATVLRSELLAPTFLRVHFHCDTLFTEVAALPTAWLRFWFPDLDGRDVEHQREIHASRRPVRIYDHQVHRCAVDFGQFAWP